MRRALPRALVVDDDHAWQDILSEILADAGLIIDVAGSLEKAAALTRSHSHRLAVIDLSLQSENPHNQDGLAVLELIRRHDPGCVAVLLTGYATVEIAVNAIKTYGAYTCLQKEMFQRRNFRDIVSKALASVPVSQASPVTRTDQAKQPGIEPENPGSIPTRLEPALVVEDDAGWRGILYELVNDAGYQVRLCASYGEAIGYLRREKFKLAVVDLSLGDGREISAPNGDGELEGYRLLASTRQGGIPTIVVSGVAAPAEIERIYRDQGVFAFLEKQAFDRQTFLRTLREARLSFRSTTDLDALTGREQEILILLSQGQTNQEIAAGLFISVNTVKRHLKAVFRKLNIHTRSAAAALAAGIKQTKGDIEPANDANKEPGKP